MYLSKILTFTAPLNITSYKFKDNYNFPQCRTQVCRNFK